MLIIRQESKNDYEEIYNVIKTVFETAEHSDGNEQDLVPEYQKQGIGKALIQEGHKKAKTLEYHYSVVLGSNKYYTKFGYIPAKEYGIIAPFDVPNENFMAIKLNDTDIEIKGIAQYAKEFGI